MIVHHFRFKGQNVNLEHGVCMHQEHLELNFLCQDYVATERAAVGAPGKDAAP